MHGDGGGAVVIHHVGGDPLAEVGLDGGHAHFTQAPDAGSEPVACGRVGKVHDCHARLPHIRLEHASIRVLDEVALLHALVKQAGALCNVGVDPHADAQTPILEPLEHCRRIRELGGIPPEACPLVFLHPEAVKVEHLQGDIPLRHAVNKGGDGFLVIGSGKGGGQPQPEGVCRRQGGLAGEGGVVGQHLLQILTADEEIL